MRFKIAIVPFILSCASTFAVENNTANVEINSISSVTVDEQNPIVQGATSPAPIAFTPVPPNRAKRTTQQQPKARPRARCRNSDGPYFAASFIYWKTKFDVMDTVVELSASKVDSSGAPFVAKIEGPNFEFSPGFKLGAGYNFKRDTWDTFVNWTRLGSHTSRNFTSSGQNLINLLVSATIGAGKVERSGVIDTKWGTLFNNLDWELAKTFMVGRYLALRPFAGVKGGWLHTTLKLKQSDSVNGDVAAEKLVNRNWGIGPRLGINTRWILADCNVGFVANFAGSLLLEQIKNTLTANITTATASEEVIIKNKHEILAPVVEVFLGLDWGLCYNKERYYFNFAVGVEGQYWVDQQLFGTILATNSSNNLNMYGLTATARFDF
jgi:hypothetical protein